MNLDKLTYNFEDEVHIMLEIQYNSGLKISFLQLELKLEINGKEFQKETCKIYHNGYQFKMKIPDKKKSGLVNSAFIILTVSDGV